MNDSAVRSQTPDLPIHSKHAAFELGAAPITLIDGEKLLNLLRQHEIGVSKKALEYLEFDPTKLAQFETQDIEEPTATPHMSTRPSRPPIP